MEKSEISVICENLYKYCLCEIPQVQNDKIVWILNGSILCNILSNVNKINGIEVSNEFRQKSLDFVRIPKGDIDISYINGISYKINIDNDAVKRFYDICEQKRFEHLFDMNSVIEERDLKQLCLYETDSGLKFYAKLPQYILLYKFSELHGRFHDEILNQEYELINKKIIHDIKALYDMSCEYIGEHETNDFLYNELKQISNSFHNLSEKNDNEYIDMIDKIVNIINSSNIKKLN